MTVAVCFRCSCGEGFTVLYLSYGSLDEAQNNEADVVWNESDGESNGKHGILTSQVDRLSTESVSHRREYDSADHHSEVEHRLRHLHKVIVVAHQVPLSP